MSSQFKTSRPGFLLTSTSSGIGCLREAIFHRLCDGWTSQKQMEVRDRLVFLRLLIALLRKLSADTLSLCWNQNSIRTHLDIGPAVRLSRPSESHASVAGATTGFWTWTSRAFSTTSIG